VKLEDTDFTAPNPSTALTPVSKSQSLASWQAYPNPFTGSTTLAFTFPETQDYTLEIYNFAGELMQRWPGARAEAGQQVQVTWMPEKAKSGLYIARLITSKGAQHLQLLKH
jgi:hypothetical protein